MGFNKEVRMRKRKVINAMLTLLMGILMVGCGSKGSPVMSSAPEWVNKGSGAYSGEMGKAFYGVGSASGIRNRSLARSTADQRARTEIARIFNTYVAALMKDYQRSTTAGDFSASSEEQDVTQVIKTFTKMTLSGVQIVDHWRDPSDGTIFSLAVLNLSDFENQLDKMKELDARVREYVRRNAEKAFEELEKEEMKH